MGNLTYVRRKGGRFEDSWIAQQLEAVRREHYPKEVWWDHVNEDCWVLYDDSTTMVFQLYRNKPRELGFAYSRYGPWGDWARYVATESMALACGSMLWDDCDMSAPWQPDVEKYPTFKAYTDARVAKAAWGTRTVLRKLYRDSVPPTKLKHGWTDILQKVRRK